MARLLAPKVAARTIASTIRDDANWLKHTLAYKGKKAHDVKLDYKDVILIDDPIFKPKERKY